MSANPTSNPFLSLRLPANLWRLSILAVGIIAAIIAIGGIAIPPIETHESYVLLAAQEMHNHGDWVVPWFNGEPHLTKPPLNYWLTLLVAWVSGGLEAIQPWHGRLVSALAGVGLVLLTALSGRKLFDDATGILAALIVASSTGFFYYTHTARPEMLYAFFCSAAMTSYIFARDATEKTQRIWGLLMWVAFALATLAKGPHVPGMLLIAFAIDCKLRKLSLRQSITLLQPAALIIFLAITMPWWWLLHHRIGEAQFAKSELSGTLLTINPLRALDLYYLYRPLQLLLPWLVFIPTLLYLPWRRQGWRAPHLLVLWIVLPALILSFGPQKRWYYMLPALMPMGLLFAAGMMEFFRRHIGQQRWVRHAHWLLLLPAIGFMAFGNSSHVWGKSRFAQRQLALTARVQVEAGHPLIAWSVTPGIYVYYTAHTLTHVHSLDEVLTELKGSPEKEFALLLQTKNIDKLPNQLKYRVLGQINGDEDGPISLLLLTTSSSTEP